ncbi:uncharacterized protein LOC107268641 isoform X2 [Cephus cinctus]|uniref:Uncharacterized protein LOC107268641 isoform X2 n=1 Tax=Cephus cinctus TaxID=211228 RepID=A0AAJ7RIS4_CEPCN|nr:uncharacterized protein LOC107268641 isoform X2 [Cephus cinctus]
MSKISLKSSRSRASIRSQLRRGKKKEENINVGFKPVNFCCTKDDYDFMTKYNQRNPPFKSSMTGISHATHGCPGLKVRLDSIKARMWSTKRKSSKTKTGTIPNVAAGSPSISLTGPLLWYHEDEIAIAKNTILDEKQRTFVEIGNKNATIGEKKEKEYDCNERIILSAIAFLALPETVTELNKRLPPVQMPRIPPKPKPPITKLRRNCISPYSENLFMRPNWKAYRNKLIKWRKTCKLIPIPRIIMPPPKKDYLTRKESAFIAEQGYKSHENPSQKTTFKVDHKKQEINTVESKKQNINILPMLSECEKKPIGQKLMNINNFDSTIKDKFEFAISGLGGNPGSVEYTISGTLNTPDQKKRSWLGEKDTHYVLSGVFENEDPPEFPVSFVMNGIANVTPTDSDDKFLTELKLGNGPKKIYPSGRQNLSRNWQEWLQNVDEEFLKIEKEASKLIKSVEATMRLVIPEPTCDSCCSCRQTRKSHMKWHQTKTPYMVIDSIAEDSNEKKYIVGSMAMHSPAPSPCMSNINLLEVIASRDNMSKQLIINGITNENGETTFYISGVTQDIEHIPHQTITKTSAPKTLKNIPPCACTIHQMFNEDITPRESTDDIAWTKKDELCFGKKYRSQEPSAYSCKESPKDRCCRRNPFNNAVKQLKRKHGKLNEADDVPHKKMYSLSAFQPCGDEDGMAICRGPWGAVNIPDPEELAAREEEARQILKAPPCGEKPGRSVCGAPWGTIVPTPKRAQDENEDEEDEEEAEEDETGTSKKKTLQETNMNKNDEKKKNVNRDKFCEMNLDWLKDSVPETGEKETDKRKDETVCQSDNQWNLFRTAPTVEETFDEYEKTLKLTPANPSSFSKTYARKETKERGEIFASKQNYLDTKVNVKNKLKQHNNKEKGKKYKFHDVEHQDKVKQRKNNKIFKMMENTKLKYKNNINTSKIRETTNIGKNNINESYQKSHQEKSVKSNLNGKKTFDVTKMKNKRSKEDTKKLPKYTNGTNGHGVKNKLLGNKTLHDKLLNTTRKQSSSNTNKIQKLDINEKLEKIKEIKDESNKILQSLEKFNIQPAIISEVPKMCKINSNSYDKLFQSLHTDNCSLNDKKISESKLIKEGPFGWKTKSEQELPAEKTLVYLAEPSYPMQTIPLRPGGKPCRCRENRMKKKILLYNIGGLINQEGNKKKQQITQLIEGVTYVTPPLSPRISDEYVPEYELYKSPYEMCAREKIDNTFKYVEQFSGPKSLLPKKAKNIKSCNFGNEKLVIIKQDSTTEESVPINQYITTENSKEKKSTESKESKEWSNTLKDEGLIDYFVQSGDNLPCWLKCAKFAKNHCRATPRKLQIMKPVCECKYERKVLKKEEEKKKRIERQKRLKTCKKQPFTHIVETSRPMAVDTKLMISDIKRIPKEDEYSDEVKYCITGVAENYSMGPVRYVVSGVTMHTPVITPAPSKEEIPCICTHRHWSPMNITPGPLPTNRVMKMKKQGMKIIDNNNELENRACSIENKRYENNVNNNYFEKSQFSHEKDRDVTGKLRSANLSPKLLKKFEDMGHLTSTINGAKYKSEIKRENINVVNKEFHAPNKTTNKILDDTLLSPFEEHLDRTNIDKFKDNTKVHKTLGRNLTQKKSNKFENNNIIDKKKDLMTIMHEELKKMANEGFPLAKLPACHLMPQLQFFIMYRKGVAYSEYDKKLIMDSSIQSWNMMTITPFKKLTKPTLGISNEKLKNLTYDNATQMNTKIAQVKALWLSELRKSRVLKTRFLWSSMEFGRFPNMSFKQAYFTYLPAKEADGHVFRPWKTSEMLHQM